MEKKLYNQPTTSVIELQVENLMLTVSKNNGGGGGVMHAPGHRGNWNA